MNWHIVANSSGDRGSLHIYVPTDDGTIDNAMLVVAEAIRLFTPLSFDGDSITVMLLDESDVAHGDWLIHDGNVIGGMV